jgi:uncharacterized protein (TIGR02453 family)
MRETLRFLQDLSLHNDKEWFDANKDRFLAAKATVETLAGELLSGIRSFDDTVVSFSPKDCTYRIYRDLRFSKDKTPYKTHMGIYINRGGKKSGYSGYYFHVGGEVIREHGRHRRHLVPSGGAEGHPRGHPAG